MDQLSSTFMTLVALEFRIENDHSEHALHVCLLRSELLLMVTFSEVKNRKAMEDIQLFPRIRVICQPKTTSWTRH